MPREIPLHIRVREVISRHDPVQLLVTTGQKDEYDPEARKIARKLRGVKSPDQLGDVVHDVFVRMFDANIAGPREDYQQLSKELYTLK